MDIDEITESPAFWLLGGGGVAAELLGYIISKRMHMMVLPIWQLLIILIGTVIIAAIFALKE